MNWWSRLFRKGQMESELQKELRYHFERQVADNVRAGLDPAEARRQAALKFGGLEQFKEDCRDARGTEWLESALQDIRFALRTLRKSPAFTITAILTLALGIGANTAIFQLLDAVRLRSLPVQNPNELAEIRIVGGNHGLGVNQHYGELTMPLWQEIRAKQKSFSGIFGWGVNTRYVGQGSNMRHFKALWVTGDFFGVLGVRPWRGRLLLPEDEGVCPSTHAVVSYSYWQNELGGRDLSEGIKLFAAEELVEVVGVTPPDFYGMVVGQTFDIALPRCLRQEGFRRDAFEVSVIGRLKPGATIQSASAEMNALSPGIFEDTVPPGREERATEMYKSFRLAAYSAFNGVSTLRKYDQSLLLLLGITGLVLLIACANLANLMLARASIRKREVAVRLALGASRSRLFRQLLSESALLAVFGAAISIALAQILSRVLVRTISTENSMVNLQMATDWRVLLFSAGIAILTCVAFGVLPAMRASRTKPIVAMNDASRGTTVGHEQLSLQRVMVVTQIAVSLVLLVGALLFVRSFRNLMTLNPGMRESGISVGFIGYWQSKLPEQRWKDFERELLEEVAAIPGVLNAATTTNVPLLGGSWEHNVHIGPAEGNSKFTWVSPDYFKTMGIPVLRGRGFTREDTDSSQRVAVVNETFAHHFFGDANPLGQTLRTEPEPNYPSTVYEIVGIIPDTRYNDLRGATPPMTFAPASQFPAQGPWADLMIRSENPAATIASIKSNLAEKHPDVIAEFQDFQRDIRDGLVQERLMATLSGFFGLLAALLATIGLYGVISYIVVTRRNEIGIRMALGASRGNVVGIILRQTLLMLALGIAIGIVLALVATQGAGTLLFGLQPNDPLTFVGASALLIAIALIASYLPAYRASRLDPMNALRYE